MHAHFSLIVAFTAKERDQLKELPNRDCILHHLNYQILYPVIAAAQFVSLTCPSSVLLDKAMKRTLYLGLVDIIFAFAYDHRTTLGESNVWLRVYLFLICIILCMSLYTIPYR